MPMPALLVATTAALAAALLAGCAADAPRAAPESPSPPLGCPDLSTTSLHLPGLKVTRAELVPVGSVTPPGAAMPLPAHCKLTGTLAERSGSVDGKPYAIGFELRLPFDWNGRFFFQ